MPVIAVAGTAGRQQVTEALARLLGQAGFAVARADGSGLHLGERRLSTGPAANHEGARRALMNPAATAVVLEVGEHAVLEEGLGFDRCQLALVTGTRDADTRIRPGVDEQVTILKAIRAAVDVVLPTGWAVLSRHDPEAVAMAEHCKGQVVLFGREDWSRWSESPAPEGVEPLLAVAAAAQVLGVSAPSIQEFLNSFAD